MKKREGKGKGTFCHLRQNTCKTLSVRSFPSDRRLLGFASHLLTLQCCDKILDTMAGLWVASLASTSEICSSCNQAMKSNFIWKLTGLCGSLKVCMSQVFIPGQRLHWPKLINYLHGDQLT